MAKEAIKYFAVSGEWVTNHARNLWVEGTPEYALHFMSVSFPKMTEEQRIKICCGKMKLTGVDRLGLEEDNTTMHGKHKLMTIEEYFKYKNDTIKELQAALDKSGIKEPRVRKTRAERLAEKAALRDRDPVYGDMIANMPLHLQAAATALFAPRLEGPPKIDREMNGMNGWLSPDGKFYPCAFMGHGRLADALNSTEAELEKAWVKIQDSHDTNSVITRVKYAGSDFPHIPSRGVTQAQLNAMQKWCEVHHRELPRNLETR